MENLRAIADKGKIIMVITHSPERAGDLFDKVIVLAKSTKDNCGHLAFYGSTKEAMKFFDVTAYKGIVKKINRPDENGEGMADYYIAKYANMQKKGEL
jgi:ABC-type multidrug transport system ATPase subunit